MGKTSATEIGGDNFYNRVFSKLIENYVGDENYFTNNFLRLGLYSDFNLLVNQTIEIVQLEMTKIKGKKLKKSNSRSFLENMIRTISKPEIRYGGFLKDEISRVLLENNEKYRDPKIQEKCTYKRIIGVDEIKKQYSSVNKLELSDLELNITDNEAPPGFLSITSNKNSSEIAMDYMKDVLSNALHKSTWKKNKKSIKYTYDKLVQNYGDFLLNRMSDPSKENRQDIYSKFLESLTSIISIIEEQNTEIITKKGRKIFKKIISKNKKSKRLNTVISQILNSKYKGGGFPRFPGIIVSDELSVLPPNSTIFGKKNVKSMNQSSYLIKIFGDGWSADGIIQNLLEIYSILIQLAQKKDLQDLHDIHNLLTNITTILVDFFVAIGLSYNSITIDQYQLLLGVLEKTGDPKRLYKEIEKIITNMSGYNLIEINDKSSKNSIEIRSFPSAINRNQRIVIISNMYSKTSEDAQGYTKLFQTHRNLLPDFALSLLTNAGIWPEKINSYFWALDLKINSDNKWNRSRNMSLLKWIKSTIDGIVLHLLLRGELALNFEHPFSKLEQNDHLLIIPILNRWTESGKTNIHQYFYDILECQTILDELYFDRIIPREIYSSGSLSHRFKTNNRTALTEFLHKYLAYKIDNEVDNQFSIGNRVNIQHFNKINLPKDFDNDYKVWSDLNLDKEKIDYMISLFNKAADKEFFRGEAYELNQADNETYPQIIPLISYIPDNGNMKIMPEVFFIMKLKSLQNGNDLAFYDNIFTKKDLVQNYKQTFDDYFHHFIKHDDPKKNKLHKSIKKLIGAFIRPDFIFGLLVNASSSLRRTDNVSPQLIYENEEIDQNLIDSGLDFITVLFESYPLSTDTSDDKENLFRLLIIHYTANRPPRYLLNEYFLNDRFKGSSNYQSLIISSIYKMLFELDKFTFIRVKNSSKTGEHYAKEYQTSIADGAWRYFTHLSLEYVNNLQDRSKEELSKLWGYVPGLMTIPQINFMKKTNPRVLSHSFQSSVFKGDRIRRGSLMKMNTSLLLLIKPQSKPFETIHTKDKNRVDESELKIRRMYAQGNGLINFSGNSVDFNEDKVNEMKKLISIASTIGDEIGSLSLTGFDRLFYYPQTESNRRVFSPALLLKGIDFYYYKE